MELEVDLLSLKMYLSINFIVLSEPEKHSVGRKKYQNVAGKEAEDEEKITVGMLPSRWRRSGMEESKEVEYQIC